MDLRQTILRAGVKRLRELYPTVNDKTIITDRIFSEFFKRDLGELVTYLGTPVATRDMAAKLIDEINQGQTAHNKGVQMDKLDLNVVKKLLVKLGVESVVAKKLNLERATKKLERRLEKGIPDGLDDAEKAVVAAVVGTKTGPATTPPDTDENSDDSIGYTDAAPAATTKAPKATTAAKAAPAPKAKGTGGIAAFKEAFKSRKQFERQELIDLVVKTGGCEKWSVANYISMAKKDGNSFGFKLEEKKTEAGKKLLTKVA